MQAPSFGMARLLREEFASELGAPWGPCSNQVAHTALWGEKWAFGVSALETHPQGVSSLQAPRSPPLVTCYTAGESCLLSFWRRGTRSQCCPPSHSCLEEKRVPTHSSLPRAHAASWAPSSRRPGPPCPVAHSRHWASVDLG